MHNTLYTGFPLKDESHINIPSSVKKKQFADKNIFPKY